MTIPEATGIIALLITLISTIGGGVAFFLTRNNSQASSLKTLSETIEKLSVRVSDLEEQRDHDAVHIRQLENLLLLCVSGLQVLTSQLLKLDLKPAWTWPQELNDWLEENTQV